MHRVYCALRLNLPRRTKRRVPTRLRQPLVAPAGLNDIWALDLRAAALAIVAGVLAFGLHRSLVETVAIMAALGIAVWMFLGG